jgi:hypothetical protein
LYCRRFAFAFTNDVEMASHPLRAQADPSHGGNAFGGNTKEGAQGSPRVAAAKPVGAQG